MSRPCGGKQNAPWQGKPRLYRGFTRLFEMKKIKKNGNIRK